MTATPPARADVSASSPESPPEAGPPVALDPATTAWLRDPRLQRLMKVVAGADEEVRIVGGAVRNTLLRRPVADVDLATTAVPAVVAARVTRAGMKAVPTGIAHGTITVVVDGSPFEVTTLRRDVETDGRRAVVAFSRDWRDDACRRDFTINALYATAGGEILDLVGGIEDCRHARVRFIGHAEDRIREDYLRILRFFRFHAAYGADAPDPPGLAACVALRDGLRTLSAERIGQEIVKLLTAPGARPVLALMAEHAILAIVLGEPADVARFDRLHARLARLDLLGAGDGAVLLLCALAGSDADACCRIATRLRLSNAVRDRMMAVARLQADVGGAPDAHGIRLLLYRAGHRTGRNALLMAAAGSLADLDDAALVALIRRIDASEPPVLPVNGRDLLAAGVQPGPSIGATMRRLEARWIASDFTLDRTGMLAVLAEPGTAD